jgi:hypothetical protein
MLTMRKDTPAPRYDRAAWYVPLSSASAAWRQALEAALSRDPNEIAPYKILPGAVDSIYKVVLERLEPFSSQRKPLAQTLYPLTIQFVLTVSGLQR